VGQLSKDACASPKGMTYSSAMSDINSDTWLSTADCAERTGLSAKALRVYERYGLITPKRLPNGWRGYDLADIERLNAISVLKAMGLTLRQIRTLLTEHSPPLKQMLEIQIEACTKRILDAERAKVIARTALQRLDGQQELTIDELCSLIRGVAMNAISPQIQRILDQYMTADQQRDWRLGTTRTRQGLDDMKAYARAQQEQIFVPLKTLVEEGAQPTAPEVEALIERNNQLMTKYAVRERLVKAYKSNPINFGNALNVGRELMRASKDDPVEFGGRLPDVDTISFFYRAAAMSAHATSIEALMIVLQQAIQSDEVTVDCVQIFAKQFCEICKRHHLGNPYVYAVWARTQHAGLDEQGAIEKSKAWELLADALEHTSAGSRVAM
jgi:DNA-binding transcriptional MerR regulator